MDGLLVDSEPLWFEAETAIMARLGSPWGPEDQEHLIGGSLPRSTAYMQSKAAVPVDRQDIGRWLVQGMADLVRAKGVRMMPGAAELLAAVGAAGIPHALVTSAEKEIMEAALDAIGVRFPATVCSADVTRSKPDPEPYLRAAGLLGAEPGRCVALEDSPSGVSVGTRGRLRRHRGADGAAPARTGPADRRVPARRRSRHAAEGGGRAAMTGES